MTNKRIINLRYEFKFICVGLIIALLLSMFFTGVAAGIFSLLKIIVKKAISPMSLLCLAAGCFFGAYMCGRAKKNRGVITGFFVSTFVLIVLSIIYLSSDKALFTSGSFVKIVIVILSGCCGGYLGDARKNSSKRKKI